MFELLLIFFVFGALLGSFANVVILRMPHGESVVFPGSHCNSCQSKIAWYDNIPILSWFILRGKCRKCQTKYSFRYPVVEFIMGFLFALSFWHFGWSWTLLEVLLFVFALVICSFIDIDHMILPDQFTLSGIVIGLLGAWLNPERDFMPAFWGFLFGGGFLFAMAYFYHLFTGQEGMGGGDIKLLAWIGAIVGWKAIPFVIMISAVLGTIFGLILQRQQKKGLKTMIPYGPYLAVAALIYLFGGQTIGLWYLQWFFPEAL